MPTIREHHGWGHGLWPGTTAAINCLACQREDAPAMIMAGGTAYRDPATGRTEWPRMEADALARVLWSMGYDTEVMPA